MSAIMGMIVPILIALVIFITVFLLIAVFSGNIEKSIDPLFGTYLKYLEQEFSILDIPITARRFMMMQTGTAILLFVLGLLIGDTLLNKLVFSVSLALLAFLFTRVYIKQKKTGRKNKFEEQFVDAIALVANAVRYGLSLMQALDLAVTEMEDPMSYEINLVIQATRVGLPLDTALTEWSKRIESKDLDIFVTAVIIQNQTGGNLTDILETLGKTIRERFRIQRQIKTLTSQGILSAYILTLLPVILGVALYFIQPDTMSLLFTTNYGLLLTLICVCMIGTGAFIVKKIITIDV
jgi:tight adherence protein B